MIVHVLLIRTRIYSHLYNQELGLVIIYALKLDTMLVPKLSSLFFFL